MRLGHEHKAFRYDYILLAIIVFLTLLGLVTLFSASYLFAANQSDRFRNILNINSGWTPLISNFLACILMLFLFPLFIFKDPAFLKNGRLVSFLVTVTIILNILPFFEIFRANPRAMRWVRLGFINFQPSELIKVVLPLYLAYILDKNKNSLDTFSRGPAPPAVVTGLLCFLVLLQSNFSDAVLIAVTGFIICFVSGIRLRWFGIALGAIVTSGLLLIFGDRDGRWYHRIANFGRHPQDPLDTGFQISQSLEAVRSGGFWGKGIGQGTLKIRMPEVHGDFVFASFTEESGFLGVLLYFTLIGLFAFICYYVAWKNRDRYTQLLAFGLVTPIVIQTMMNIAVVANIIPTTGVPLPFVSSGGSSLLVTLISCALLVSITRGHVLNNDTERKYAR